MMMAKRGCAWFRQRAIIAGNEQGLALHTAATIADISDEPWAKQLYQLNIELNDLKLR